jgi:hypothetical protein
MHLRTAVRDHALHEDEEDPKKPRPVRTRDRRRTPNIEAEAEPWLHLRKEDERDHHRHVC